VPLEEQEESKIEIFENQSIISLDIGKLKSDQKSVISVSESNWSWIDWISIWSWSNNKRSTTPNPQEELLNDAEISTEKVGFFSHVQKDDS